MRRVLLKRVRHSRPPWVLQALGGAGKSFRISSVSPAVRAIPAAISAILGWCASDQVVV